VRIEVLVGKEGVLGIFLSMYIGCVIFVGVVVDCSLVVRRKGNEYGFILTRVEFTPQARRAPRLQVRAVKFPHVGSHYIRAPFLRLMLHSHPLASLILAPLVINYPF
jgi:hypothetical protein